MDIQDSLKELLTGAGVSFFGIAFAQILTLVSEILFARILGPGDYGEVGLAISISVSLAMIAALGMPQGVARMWRDSESEKERQSLLLSSYLIVGGVSSVVILLFWAIPQEISEIINSPSLAPLLPPFSIYIVSFSLSLVTVGALRGMKKPGLAVTSREVLPKSFGLLVFILFALQNSGYFGVIWFWISAGVVSLFISVYFVYISTGWRTTNIFNAGIGKMPELWSFSWPVAIESVLTNLMINFDIIMIGYFLQSSSVGFYRSIQPLSRGLPIFLSAFIFLYMPMATDYYKDGEISELNSIYLSTTKWATFLTYPLALLFIFNSEAVVATFFGDQYLPAASALSILSLGMFLRVVVGPNGATIKAINRTKVDLLASIAGVLSNIVLNFILIPRLGFSGAAVATAVSYLIFNVVDSTVVYLSTGIHPLSVSTFKQLLPSGIVAWYISTMNFSFVGIYRIGFLGLVLLFIHFVSYVITGSIDSNDDILINIIENNLGVDLSILRSG